MIYQTFLSCHEGFTSCGYVPINQTTGEVLGHNGVTIGAGFDLSKSRTSFPTLSSTIVDKLEPYFGLKGNLAACAAIEHALTLAQAEAVTLTNVITNNVVNKVFKSTTTIKTRMCRHLHQFLAVFAQLWSAFGTSLATHRLIQSFGVL